MSDPIPVLVERRADELTIQGIYADYVRTGLVRVVMCWDAGSQMSLASGSLLRNPTLPVALAFNCPADAAEFRLPIERYLNGTASLRSWHAAFASPDTTVWTLLDSEFARHWERCQHAGQTNTRTERAVQFKEWLAAGNRFRLDIACNADSELDGLTRFLELKIHSLAAA